MRKIPLYPLLFSIYPALALAVHNLGEIELTAVVRSMLVSLIFSMFLYAAARLIFKDWSKAAAVTVFCLVLFFSYGHLYHILETNPIAGVNLGRHRILIGVYTITFIFGIYTLVRKIKDYRQLTQALTTICIILLIIPLVQYGRYINQTREGYSIVSAAREDSTTGKSSGLVVSPDVYFIILDSYIREDALVEDFSFDNSDFLESLRQMGFYVADCSRSNYSHTQPSLTSALNMEYITSLFAQLDQTSMDRAELLPFLKDSLVRQELESLGYQTIAFETGYAWSNLSDADIFLRIGSDPMTMHYVSPFESMLLKTTAFLVLMDSQSKLLLAQMSEVNFPYKEDIDRQEYLLDQLPQVATIPGKKFVFAHILIPHIPYVFASDGTILSDPGFYSGKNDTPIDEEHLIEGYRGEVQYLNSRILPILEQILTTSKTPPVIVMMGDHGLSDENRYQILNTYYLPDNGSEALYPSITPVNSFRLIFDTYFGGDYGLLPDYSYEGLDRTIIQEISPDCLP